MNELMIFNNPEFGEIRTIEEDGKVLFCGADVAKALGYSNSRDALSRHCKGVVKRDTPTSSGEQEMSFIPESDLYRMVFGSKLPNAEIFTDWVTEDVLPSIRKHGLYAMDELLDNPDLAIHALMKLKEEREKRKALESETAQQKQLLAEYSPKVSYYDVVLQTKDVLSIGKIAKDYGKSARWLNQLLHEKGVQFKQGGVWLLYQKHAEQGYTKSKTETYSGSDGQQHSKLHTYWTQKGRLFIYSLLKENGVLPLVELEDNNKVG